MSNIFQALDIAKRAIWANRMGLDVAAHNIANVNTPGYSRQQVNIETVHPLQAGNFQIGLGAEAVSISRVRNQLLDLQYREANQKLGGEQIAEQMLYQIENIIQEPSDSSVGNLMLEFFTEFSNLGTEPENTTLRNVLLQKSIGLTEAFQFKSKQLTEIQSSLRTDIKNTVTLVNELSRELADLNRKIMVSEDAFGNANDLRDRRDQLLDQLSGLTEVQYTEDNRGNLTVSTAGQLLVSGVEYRELTVENSEVSGNFSVSVKGAGQKVVNILGGKLAGLLKTHNTVINNLLDSLDNLAKGFIEEVNRVHQFGQGLPVGNPPTSATGLDYFNGSDASSITINSEILANVSNIAASNDGTPGNGEVAFSIANLRNFKVFEGKTQTFEGYYNNMVSNLGTEIQVAFTKRQNNELLKSQIQNQREAEFGVSLDEEMTNLIKHQRSLEAAAKVISVVDDILETVINM